MTVQIGYKFDYLGKHWVVTKIGQSEIYYQSLDGYLRSSMKLDAFIQQAENVKPGEG